MVGIEAENSHEPRTPQTVSRALGIESSLTRKGLNRISKLHHSRLLDNTTHEGDDDDDERRTGKLYIFGNSSFYWDINSFHLFLTSVSWSPNLN